MAYVALGAKAVGSTVKLNINGDPIEFIVVHQGLPSDIYDASCDGTWLLRKNAPPINDGYAFWANSGNIVCSYDLSNHHANLNGNVLNGFDADIRDAIKHVKIPYVNGNGMDGSVDSGSNGLPTQLFLLSAPEVGENTVNMGDGACLSYFNDSNPGTVASKRLYWDKSETVRLLWPLRSPWKDSKTNVAIVDHGNGYLSQAQPGSRTYMRYALILPFTVWVSDDGSIIANLPPTIASGTANGSNLGNKTVGFNFTYSINDADGDTVTVKEYLDDVLQRSYTAILGASNTFQAVTADNFQKVLNGVHTLKVVANDGKDDSEAYTATFTKKVTTASVTLAEPLEADDQIGVMVMAITGSIPGDAVLEVLVTNNAKDYSPVWEDATKDIQAGVNHIFTNKTAANGFAFNFKLTVSRGAGDIGGYISNIGGAFE